ncbi:MAG: response regulator [Chloroflexota bacterium]|nr:response regulator [Chloroflexota bacterium]
MSAMSDQWRILVVEDEEYLNQNMVNSLRKDNYLVHGVKSGAEAIRQLWTEEYDVAIGDLKTPGADGFELLQWIRSYRPNTRMIMVAPPDSTLTRTQALEAGVVSYLEKPLDMHLLKEELRRLLQHTGFSANLDSFDLLDLIQIISMTRKSIALLLNIGLEERGILRFQHGDLIWAEYGMLRGEEAFFALAAHKNGTVIHQPWNEQITPNVTQSLSRLIYQALQYRAKYAQQLTGEQEAVKVQTSSSVAQSSPLQSTTMQQDEIDDSPFWVLEDEQVNDSGPVVPPIQVAASGNEFGSAVTPLPALEADEAAAKEWWQETGKMPASANGNGRNDNNGKGKGYAITDDIRHTPPPDRRPLSKTTKDLPSSAQGTSGDSELPSWLIEQPTRLDMPPVENSFSDSFTEAAAATEEIQPLSPAPAVWQPLPKTEIPASLDVATGKRKAVSQRHRPGRPPDLPEPQEISPAIWQPPEEQEWQAQAQSGSLSVNERPERRKSGSLATKGSGPLREAARRNYSALVAALQSLGYAIPGFVAAAVVSLDGHPIAQVAVDDLDISKMCVHFSHIVQGAGQFLDQGNWGTYETTTITSTDRHILLSLVGSEKKAFQVLITTRDADPSESMEVMANVEDALAAALR